MTPPAGEKLREHIRSVMAKYPDLQPCAIAHIVATTTPKENLVDWYESTLGSAVLNVIAADRNRALNKALASKKPAPDDGYISPKVKGIRNWWVEMMECKVRAEDGHKLLGDCTIADLKFCVEERRQDITELENRISQYELLIRMMQDHDVQTVRELPEPKREELQQAS